MHYLSSFVFMFMLIIIGAPRLLSRGRFPLLRRPGHMRREAPRMRQAGQVPTPNLPGKIIPTKIC